MTEFKPPISDRQTDELIEIVHLRSEDWSEEAIRQATHELKNRKISDSNLEEEIEKWENEYKENLEKAKIEEKLRLESNRTESYKIYEMILLFLLGPIKLFTPQRYGFATMTIFDLKSENFQLKYKQRLIIFGLSFIAWYAFINFEFYHKEKERMEKIENVDIFGMERNTRI